MSSRAIVADVITRLARPIVLTKIGNSVLAVAGFHADYFSGERGGWDVCKGCICTSEHLLVFCGF